MIRIIAGRYKGRKLVESHSPLIRPTLARVKKSMLQILEPFSHKRVLDLFCGVGTLGIEAVSRGADSVTFVERDYQIFRILSRNINDICREDSHRLYRMDVRKYIALADETFDIIIADPPYGTFKFETLLDKVKPLLNPGGVFCMEMRKTPIADDSLRIKLYGKTQVVFWRAEE